MTAQPVDNALALLTSINEETATEMWIPSRGRVGKFRPLTALNQRDMITTLAGTQYLPSALTITAFDVIKDTCCDPTVDVNKLTSIDKVALILQTRISNIEPTIKLRLDEQTQAKCNLINNGPYQHVVDLKSWVQTIKSQVYDTTPQIIETGRMVIELRVPLLKDEAKFQQQIYDFARASKQQNVTSEQIVGHVFMNTLCQYVHKLTIDDVTIDFSDLPAPQCISLLSKFPGALLKRIGTIINRFDEITKSMLTVDFTLNEHAFTGQIPIDSSLFE